MPKNISSSWLPIEPITSLPAQATYLPNNDKIQQEQKTPFHYMDFLYESDNIIIFYFIVIFLLSAYL
jgi:hypothetical protein